jgi:hypothetical protein
MGMEMCINNEGFKNSPTLVIGSRKHYTNTFNHVNNALNFIQDSN